MARNPYGKATKLFVKASDLFVTRKEEEIFISEGHMIMKVPKVAYDLYFRPVSGQFVNLADGESANRRGNETIPEKNPASVDMARIFDSFRSEACETISPTPFLMEYSPDGKKKALQRMLTGNNFYVCVNNDFYGIAEEIGLTTFQNKGTSISGIIAESGSYGIVILPIRADQQKIDDFVRVGR